MDKMRERKQVWEIENNCNQILKLIPKPPRGERKKQKSFTSPPKSSKENRICVCLSMAVRAKNLEPVCPLNEVHWFARTPFWCLGCPFPRIWPESNEKLITTKLWWCVPVLVGQAFRFKHLPQYSLYIVPVGLWLPVTGKLPIGLESLFPGCPYRVNGGRMP